MKLKLERNEAKSKLACLFRISDKSGEAEIKYNKGFTLVELLAAVAIVGVIATLALPRYRSMVARSRQAEATTNLGTISELQKSYYYDGERGYYHGGMHYGIDKCAKSATEAHNELGFRLADCSKSRYRYITNSGNDCAKSDGSIEQGQVYPGCNSNDVWHISTTGQLTNPHDVVSKCPLGIVSASATCNPGSLPSPPPAPLSTSSTARTPSPPPAPLPPTCSHSHCWVLADKSCVKCGIVGGIKTTVPCSTCKIPKDYVYKPPPPPTVYVAPPSSPPSGSPSGSPSSGGGGGSPSTCDRNEARKDPRVTATTWGSCINHLPSYAKAKTGLTANGKCVNTTSHWTDIHGNSCVSYKVGSCFYIKGCDFCEYESSGSVCDD